MDVSDDMVNIVQQTFKAKWNGSAVEIPVSHVPMDVDTDSGSGRQQMNTQATSGNTRSGQRQWNTEPPGQPSSNVHSDQYTNVGNNLYRNLPESANQVNQHTLKLQYPTTDATSVHQGQNLQYSYLPEADSHSHQPPHPTGPDGTTNLSKQPSSQQPPSSSNQRPATSDNRMRLRSDSAAAAQQGAGDPLSSGGLSSESDNEPVGTPYLNIGTEQSECLPQQVCFRGTDLVVVFQRIEASEVATQALVLWQDSQNTLKDHNSKHCMKKLSPQAQSRMNDSKKNMTNVGSVIAVETKDKLFIMPVVSTMSSVGEEEVRMFTEQALNKANHARKMSVAIPRIRRAKGKGTLSSEDFSCIFI